MLTFTEPSTKAEIQETFPLMVQLRPDLAADRYACKVSSLMQAEGYRLAGLRSDGRLVALAGYRYITMLYAGKTLFIDDLVVDAQHRGAGFGGQLLWWLEARARQEDCVQLHLISRVVRERAHRFYFSHNYGIECFHFRRNVRTAPSGAPPEPEFAGLGAWSLPGGVDSAR